MLSAARALTMICIVLALCVVLLGGWTRISNAGLSCPDWPGCYGEMVIPVEKSEIGRVQQLYPQTPFEKEKAWLEMGHRYLAGSLGLLISLLAGIGWKLKSTVQAYPFKTSLLLLGLVVIQAVFGMWTVTMKLLPQIVTLHLLGGLLTLSLLVLFWHRVRDLKMLPAGGHPNGVRSWVAAGVLLLLLQILLGGWVSSNYAGYACEDWLLCNPDSAIEADFSAGFSLPSVGQSYLGGAMSIEARAAIQLSHRVGAVLVMVYVLFLYFKYSHLNLLRGLLQLLLGVMFIQIVVGVLNVIYALPEGLAMLHHAGAVCLLLVALILYGRTARITEDMEYG